MTENIRITPIRKQLLEIFKYAKKPMSHIDVNEIMKISRATFYRNTLQLEKMGVLDSLDGQDKRRYFEIKQKQHAHFICNICNSIECVEMQNISLKNKTVTSIIINGKCSNCNEA